MLRWPNKQAVDRAAREWALKLGRERPDLVAVGYFGSYARGDWGVGSDVDLIVLLARTSLPFERRATDLDTVALPVPADVLVYTRDEWRQMAREPAGRRVARDLVWVYGAESP